MESATSAASASTAASDPRPRRVRRGRTARRRARARRSTRNAPSPSPSSPQPSDQLTLEKLLEKLQYLARTQPQMKKWPIFHMDSMTGRLIESSDIEIYDKYLVIEY